MSDKHNLAMILETIKELSDVTHAARGDFLRSAVLVF